MAQTNKANPKKGEIHVLSLDGGGSRGIMESIMLGHVMDLSTLMIEKPSKITEILRNFQIDGPEVGRKFQALIELENLSPIHPTEAFQYIVGTSTGSLITFGLVGGKEDQNGKRVPMSVKEVTELYQEVIPKIFIKAKNGNGFKDWALEKKGSVGGTPLTPYTQKFLKLAVDEKFGTALTEDIGHNGCLAGAVARQFNEDSARPDLLDIFDSKSEPAQLVSEVLLGSSDAPIYFEVPSQIGHRNYIDGGVAGNCPLGQALPRIKTLYPLAKVMSVLALAPPAHKHTEKLEELKTQWEKTAKMGKYIVDQMTDGEAVFKNAKDNNPEAHFLRVRPTLDKSAEFPMDEVNVQKMIDAMKDELRENPEYMRCVLKSAAIIALRMLETFSVEHLEMFEVAIMMPLIKMRCYQDGIFIAEEILKRLPNSDENNDYKGSFQQKIGSCQNGLEQFEASSVSYQKALELAVSSSGDENSKNINKGTIMHTMAISFRNLNNLEEAIKGCKQSLEMHQKRPDSPAKHYDIATTLNSIGICYQDLGEYQKALDEFYEKARDQLQGAEDDQATKELKSWLFNNEGNCHDALGHYEKALEAYENDLAIQKEINASAEDLGGTLNNIGKVLSAQGKHQEALVKHKESLEKEKKHSGQDAKTVGIATSLYNIGKEYRDLKNYAEAGKWLREALAMDKIVHRGNHPNTAGTWNTLGLNYRDQGGLDKAKDFHKQAYDMIMACEGHDDLKYMVKRNLDKTEKMLSKNQ